MLALLGAACSRDGQNRLVETLGAEVPDDHYLAEWVSEPVGPSVAEWATTRDSMRTLGLRLVGPTHDALVLLDVFATTREASDGFLKSSPLDVVPCAQTFCKEISNGLYLRESVAFDTDLLKNAGEQAYCLASVASDEYCALPTLWAHPGNCTLQITIGVVGQTGELVRRDSLELFEKAEFYPPVLALLQDPLATILDEVCGYRSE